MRILVLWLACGVVCADAAVAQQVINPIALAPAARAALPQSGVTTVPMRRSIRYARQRLPQRSATRIGGSALIDWPSAI
jgi:hypothetical protein